MCRGLKKKLKPGEGVGQVATAAALAAAVDDIPPIRLLVEAAFCPTTFEHKWKLSFLMLNICVISNKFETTH